MGTTKRFIQLESLAGLALIGAALLGMLVANSPLSGDYQRMLQVPLEVSLGGMELSKPLLLWINDGLMAIFFLLVALELKRELLGGELSKPGQITLPLVAAIGGIIVPAAAYAAWNWGDPEALKGWAIPAATDIAFALGVLAMLGDRVPKSIKVFLLSLAVFDDLGAILIIAAFYTEEISWTAKALALASTALLVLFNRFGVRRIAAYALVGIVLWFFVLKSGVHATLAGVVVGLTIPHDREGGNSPLLHLEHGLHPWVAFMIVPIFAFANAGVPLAGFGEVLTQPVALGIMSGLVVGKTVGVFGISWVAVRTGLAKIPEGANWGMMLGVSILSGIGFTMSLFIGSLAFEFSTQDFGAPLRVGVLGGSLVAAVLGFVVLRRALARPAVAAQPAIEQDSASAPGRGVLER